jgi:hypothetical protein
MRQPSVTKTTLISKVFSMCSHAEFSVFLDSVTGEAVYSAIIYDQLMASPQIFDNTVSCTTPAADACG